MYKKTENEINHVLEKAIYPAEFIYNLINVMIDMALVDQNLDYNERRRIYEFAHMNLPMIDKDYKFLRYRFSSAMIPSEAERHLDQLVLGVKTVPQIQFIKNALLYVIYGDDEFEYSEQKYYKKNMPTSVRDRNFEKHDFLIRPF